MTLDGIAKQTQVSAQLARQQAALGDLADTISKLEERLDSILRPETNVKASPEISQEQELVPLAGQIRTNTFAIERQDKRLSQILSRLEL